MIPSAISASSVVIETDKISAAISHVMSLKIPDVMFSLSRVRPIEDGGERFYTLVLGQLDLA